MSNEDNRQAALMALENFKPSIVSPHKPEIMCVTCIDGREGAGHYFHFNQSAVRVTEIAAVIPPYANAPANTRAKFSFTKLKGISTVKVVGHSFCGGAQTAIAHPDPDKIENPEIRDIVASITESGAHIKDLCGAFLLAAEGNATHAANLLSRHLVLVSLDNVTTYPYIERQIQARQLDTLPLFHVMKEGTGEYSHLERYDIGQRAWIRTGEPHATHMCARPFNCSACASCHGTIGQSLELTPLDYLGADGRIGQVNVPAHIARLIRNRRRFYQPALARLTRVAIK